MGLVLHIPTGNHMDMAFGCESRFLKDPRQKEQKAQGAAAFHTDRKKNRSLLSVEIPTWLAVTGGRNHRCLPSDRGRVS